MTHFYYGILYYNNTLLFTTLKYATVSITVYLVYYGSAGSFINQCIITIVWFRNTTVSAISDYSMCGIETVVL